MLPTKIICFIFVILAVAGTGEAVYVNAAWDPDEVDFTESSAQLVETRVHLITHCLTLMPYPASVALATSAGGVKFYLDGEEIRQRDLVEFEWTFEAAPVPHLYVDETLEIEVIRDPNVTEAFETQQRWMHFGQSFAFDNCPYSESVYLQPILYGEDQREYIHFTAAEKDGDSTASEESDGPDSMDETNFSPAPAWGIILLLGVIMYTMRTRSA